MIYKIKKILTALIILCGFSAIISANELEVGFDFEKINDYKKCRSIRKVKINEKIKLLAQTKKPIFISYLESEGADESKGCLKINISDLDKVASLSSWNIGVGLDLKKSFPKGKVAVTFMAKSISGSKKISITRAFGGGSKETVLLTDKWQKYSVELKNKIPMAMVIFTTLGPNNKAAVGEFLLDNISIKAVKTEKTSE